MNPLIEKYIKLVSEQNEYSLNSDYKKANRIHKEIMETIELIKNCDLEDRNEFYELLSYDNDAVKVWTAVTLLRTFEEKALRILKDIADNNTTILSIDAKMSTENWKLGQNGSLNNLVDWKNLPEES